MAGRPGRLPRRAAPPPLGRTRAGSAIMVGEVRTGRGSRRTHHERQQRQGHRHGRRLRLPRDRRPPLRRGAAAARHGAPAGDRPDPARGGRLVRPGHLPQGAGQGVRRPRPAGHAPRGLRLRRHLGRGLRPGLPRARGRRLGRPIVRVGPGQPGHVPHLGLRLGGAEAGVAAPHGRRRGHRLLRPDRARLGLGPRLDAHDGPARPGRRLDPRRHQDVDHQRPTTSTRRCRCGPR